jgi:hypothetical protein
LQTSSSTGDLVVTPAIPTAAGTLTGTVTVVGCVDPQCSAQVSGSPVIIPVTYVVAPQTLQVSSAAIAFDYVDGLSPSYLSTTLSVTDPASLSASVSVSYGPGAAGWLTAPVSITVSPDSLTVTATPGGLPEGTYTATIALTSAGGARQIPVTLGVARPALHAGASTLSFWGQTGQSSLPASQSFSVTADGGAPLPYTTAVTYDPGATGWLSVPASGTAGSAISISANTASLAPGSYHAAVRLTPAGSSSPVDVQVGYTVVAAQLGLSPASLAFSVDASTEPVALTTTLGITDTGVALGWTVSGGAPWLTVAPASGTTGTTVAVSVDPQALTTLANGSHTATLTFTSNGPGVSNAVKTATVELLLDLPRVTQVAPYVAYTGEQKEVVVRGEGFLALGSPDIEFDATAAASVVVVNDTELRVTPPPGLAAGAHAVSLANGNRLSIARHAGRLFVRTKPTHTPGLIASAGPRKRLVYDAERGCLYGASTAANAVQRWCDADGWTASSLALSGVKDIALTPDGAELLALCAETLYRISTTSFTVTASVPSTALGIYTSPPYQALNAIAAPNDGRPVLIVGTQGLGWQSLYRVDPESWTATELTHYPDTWYSAASPSDVALSLDGDRMITGESGISSPDYLLYDASDGTVTLPRSSEWAAAHVSIDRTGTRIGSWGMVYTRTFVRLGTTVDWRMTVSPDGTRAYALQPADYGPTTLRTYDVSDAGVTEVGTGSTLSPDPGTAGNPSNLLLVSLDGGTLFLDGPNGIVVLAAP